MSSPNAAFPPPPKPRRGNPHRAADFERNIAILATYEECRRSRKPHSKGAWEESIAETATKHGLSTRQVERIVPRLEKQKAALLRRLGKIDYSSVSAELTGGHSREHTELDCDFPLCGCRYIAVCSTIGKQRISVGDHGALIDSLSLLPGCDPLKEILSREKKAPCSTS